MSTMSADRHASRVWPRSDRPTCKPRDGRHDAPPGALERRLRSALGRLERTMASTRSRRIGRRRALAAQGKWQGPPVTAYSERTLALHRELVEAIRRVETGACDPGA